MHREPFLQVAKGFLDEILFSLTESCVSLIRLFSKRSSISFYLDLSPVDFSHYSRDDDICGVYSMEDSILTCQFQWATG